MRMPFCASWLRMARANCLFCKKVRRRHPAFPNGEENRAEFAQPSTMAHADFSREGAFLRMADVFPGQELYYENRSFDLIK